MTDESKPPIKASKLWQKAQFLTIAESINLSLDYEPSNTREPPDGCNAVFKLLQESINDENNQLKFFKKIYKTPLKKQSSYLYAGISEQPVEIDFFKSKITLDDFKVWLIEKNLKPSWLFDPDEETPANAPPMQKIESTLLTALNQAAIKFWANVDPNEKDTYPSNKDVETWLISQGFSSTLAQRLPSIIRPDWAK